MDTINDFLNVIREDLEIKNLIQTCKHLKRDHKPRNIKRSQFNSGSTKSGIVLDYFWESLDGIKLRIIFETRYKVDLNNTRQTGKLKTSLLIYIKEVIGE